MKSFTFLLLATILFSCANSKKTTKNSTSTQKTEQKEIKAKAAILSQNIGKFRDSESYKIISVELDENILQLDITYNGGCKSHEFELVGSSFIMKSLPPKRGIQLYHHKSNDDCRELVNDRLFFDISAFAYGEDKEIILNLQYYPQAIKYTKKNENPE